MLCERCGKNTATVHAIQSINGVKKEGHYCSQCAKEMQLGTFGSANFGFFSPADLLKGFFELGEPQSSTNTRTCPTCGTVLQDFQKTGLLGCSDCYNQFRDAVIPVLQRMHGNVQHVGTNPLESEEATQKRREIATLKEEMNRAIAEENFEEAAKLRDKINALQQEGEK